MLEEQHVDTLSSNLVLIWDSEDLLYMGLPDSSQPITIVIVGVMMAITMAGSSCEGEQ